MWQEIICKVQDLGHKCLEIMVRLDPVLRKLENLLPLILIFIFGHSDDTTLMAESEEELKSLLMKVKDESEKLGLKVNIQKTKIMASGPITSWQIDGETEETVAVFIFLGSKVTADGDCSHEVKRCLLFGMKVLTYLSSVQFSHSVVSDSLRPHELQHARPPCPSPTPRVHSDSHPRSKHLLISWLQSPSAVTLESKKIKSDTLSIVPSSTCCEVKGPGAMILAF